MFLRDGDERLVVGLQVADERAVSLHNDSVGIAIVDDLALLVPWMQLDLVHGGRPHLCPRLHLLHVTFAEIAHADGARLAVGVQPLQRLPHLLPVFSSAVRAVDQEEVHVAVVPRVDGRDAVEAFRVRLVDGAGRGEDFGGEEDFAARDAGLAHRFAHLALVLVELRRVDVAVAGAQGGEAGGDADVGRGAVDAEAEAGHGVRGVEDGDGGLQGELCGGGHGVGGGGVFTVVGFCGGAALICCLVFGWEGLVVLAEVTMFAFVKWVGIRCGWLCAYDWATADTMTVLLSQEFDN